MAKNEIIFNTVRDWLDDQGFTPQRISALDQACAQYLIANGVAVTMPPAPSQPTADDKYLTLFQRLSEGQGKPEVVQAMARSFAAHAPAYGQDKTPERIAEFVAQIANETGGFKAFYENLNYSATRMMQVWGRRIRDEAARRGISAAALAAQLDRKPELIANVVYQRPENGNTQPGDGWRYRGRGALQLTFRNNYRLYGQNLGIDLEGNPDLAADPAISVQIALEFFKIGKVNAAIDRGNFTEARRITNGGAHGLENVARLRALALKVLQ